MCPVDCEVENWSTWSECSGTCDGGTKTRTKRVVQYAKYGGKACPDLEERLLCNADSCKGDSQPRLNAEFHETNCTKLGNFCHINCIGMQ